MRVVARAEGEVLAPVRAALHVAHRVLVEADRVPLLELDDLVVDLHAGGAFDDDVDLFLARVFVAEGDPKPRREREQAQAEGLALDRRAGEARLHSGRHVELRRGILDVAEVGLGVCHLAGRGYSAQPNEYPA